MTSLKIWLEKEKKELKDGFYVYPKRKILFLFLAVFLLLLSIFRLWSVTFGESVSYFDNLAVQRLDQLRTPFFDKVFSIFALTGSGYFMAFAFVILSIFLFKIRRRKAAAAVFLTLVGSGIFIFGFKRLFDRPRPFGCPPGLDCFSFPSGHVTVSFYFYGLLLYLIGRFVSLKKRLFVILSFLIILLIFLVALSRVYLGVHFPTDIVGGFLLGGIFLFTAAILIDFLYQ